MEEDAGLVCQARRGLRPGKAGRVFSLERTAGLQPVCNPQRHGVVERAGIPPARPYEHAANCRSAVRPSV